MQRNEKRKEVLGGCEEGGEREEVSCGRYRDSRNGVQTHFADLVNNPGPVDAGLARNGLGPAAGFLFPPEAGSRLPPLQAASPLRYLGAAGNRSGPAPPRPAPAGGERPPSPLPAPLPSAPSLPPRLCSQRTWVTLAPYCEVPKAKVKPPEEQHPRPARPGSGRDAGSQLPSHPPPPGRLPFPPAPSHASALPPTRPDRVRGCCCGAHTHALCNFPVLRGDRFKNK